MNSRHSGFETFHDDQVAVRRQFHSRNTNTISDRFNDNTAIIVTVLALVITLLVRLYSSDGSLEGLFGLLGTFLWDTLVFLTPAPLVFAIDDWVDSSPARPMRNTQQSTHAAKSVALQRVMGLDRPGGMMGSVFRARTRALSMTGSVLGLKLESEQPPGLGNRDNSCYQNSILQGLASLRSMPDYLSTCVKGIDGARSSTDKNVAHSLRRLIAELNDVSNNGKTLWTPTLLKSMSTWTQQDAQEYYSKILDDIDKGAALAAKALSADRITGLEGADNSKDEGSGSEASDDSGYQSLSSSSRLDPAAIRNPLEGLVAQRVACVQCGYSDGLSMIPFNCLTLSLGLDKNHHDLYDRLDSYSKVERIDGVECQKCTLLKAQRLLTKLVDRLQTEGSAQEQLIEPLRRLKAVENALEDDEIDEETIKEKCKITAQGRVTTTKTKQMVIARPPQSLVIHVNRSVFDPSTFNMIKNSAPVNFPMMLDLGPWCLGSAEQEVESEKGQVSEQESGNVDRDSEEHWQLDPMSSMIAGDAGESRLTGPIYELRAAVTHYGRHENGHYICYRKYPPISPDVQEKEGANAGTGDTTDGGIDDPATEAIADDATSSPASSVNNRDGTWWRLSDHNVSRIDEDIVMSLSPGVFMLFYECVDPSMILQSEAEDELHDAAETAETVAQAAAGDDGGTFEAELVPHTESARDAGEPADVGATDLTDAGSEITLVGTTEEDAKPSQAASVQAKETLALEPNAETAG